MTFSAPRFENGGRLPAIDHPCPLLPLFLPNVLEFLPGKMFQRARGRTGDEGYR